MTLLLVFGEISPALLWQGKNEVRIIEPTDENTQKERAYHRYTSPSPSSSLLSKKRGLSRLPTTESEKEIRRRIVKLGKITFAEFMELALYHPVDGYYARERIGASGDYYTSPTAHPAFGALIAIQLHTMWERLDQPSPFHAVEVGAGNGLLARDIINYSRHLPGRFHEALLYITVDRMPPAANDEPGNVHSLVSDGLPFVQIVGCILSNELIDSFPVHRFEIVRGIVREVFVTLTDGAFTEVLGKPSTHLLAQRPIVPNPSSQKWPDGFRGEVNPGIGPWKAKVAGALSRGFVLTIDYGYEAAMLESGNRPRGTLQTYSRHTQGTDLYNSIGRQDLTAHVNFSDVISKGKATGLNPLALQTQSMFLRTLGLNEWLQRLRTERLPQQEFDANMMAMREIASPNGLGAFKVLIQEKNTGVTSPSLLTPEPPLTPSLPIPRLGPDHIRLLEGRYPRTIPELGQV